MPGCAFAGWFGRVDSNHDGVISRDEFMADAQTQFQRMDIDGKGYIASEALERFRKPYRQQTAGTDLNTAQDNENATQPQQGKHRHGGSSRGGNRNSAATDSGTDEQPDTTDPVMSADTNLDFKVTHEEFTTHAQKVFDALDVNHDDALSQDEILARCPKKP